MRNVRGLFRFEIGDNQSITETPIVSGILPGDTEYILCLHDGGRPLRLHVSGRPGNDYVRIETGSLWPFEGPKVAVSAAAEHVNAAYGLANPTPAIFAALTADQAESYKSHPIRKEADRKVTERFAVAAGAKRQFTYTRGVVDIEVVNLGGVDLWAAHTDALAEVATGTRLSPGVPVRWRGGLHVRNPSAASVDLDTVQEVQTP